MTSPGLFESGDAPVDMQMAAAALLADSKDVKMMLRVLARNLQSTLADRVEVTRSAGGLLHRQTDEVRAVMVHLGQDDYVAELEGHGVRCTVSRSSGGIRIRNEEVAIEQWLTRLLGALQVLAVENQSARAALQNVIVGGSL